MNFTTNSSLDGPTNWASKVAALLEQSSDGQAVQGVKDATAQFKKAKFQIAVLGKAKRGKSTLINALLGRRDDLVAPIDKLPASSAITRFQWGEQEQAAVSFRDGRSEPISFDQIRQYVTEEFNRENCKSVNVVDVSGPFPGLDRDLILIDTPGAASIHEHHDALLHAFIPQADAVVFLLTARMPLDQDELELLSQVKGADIQKIFFAINKVDEMEEPDIAAAIQHNQALLGHAGVSIQQIHRISAKRAFQGELAQSGVDKLVDEIAMFLSANKGRVLEQRFISRVKSQAAPALLALGIELAGYRKSTAELDADLEQLRAKKRTIESERGLAEREFTRVWTVAVDQFEQGLGTAKQDVTAEITRKISDTKMLDVSKLARQLPTTLNSVIEARLTPLSSALERAARAASEKLQATYPTLTVAQTGAIDVRTKESSTFLASLMGGGTAAAMGVGVVAAGSTVAAGIAAANAAALAATTTVAAPSVISSLFTSFGLGSLASLATGTATVAAPAAVATTPLWVALAGPVGWTLAGVGLLAVPFSWRLSKLKLKENLEQACREQIQTVFSRLQTERVPALRNMSKTIVEEFQIKLDRELQQIEAAMIRARDHRPAEPEIARLEQLANGLATLLQECPISPAG